MVLGFAHILIKSFLYKKERLCFYIRKESVKISENTTLEKVIRLQSRSFP